MGYSDSDAASGAAGAVRAEEALSEAVAAAETLADQFAEELTDAPLRPVVTVRLAVGAEDQPVFVFDLLVDLADDLDADDYPIDDISQLRDQFRARVAHSSVEDWDWIVNTGTRTGAATG